MAEIYFQSECKFLMRIREASLARFEMKLMSLTLHALTQSWILIGETSILS